MKNCIRFFIQVIVLIFTKHFSYTIVLISCRFTAPPEPKRSVFVKAVVILLSPRYSDVHLVGYLFPGFGGICTELKCFIKICSRVNNRPVKLRTGKSGNYYRYVIHNVLYGTNMAYIITGIALPVSSRKMKT